jgi:hypothetical protein
VIEKDTPKVSRSFEYGHGFIVPSKVLNAMAAEGHAPAVARKPRVGCSGASMSSCTRTVRKGEEVTLNTRRVDEQMSIGSADANQSIRISDKTSTAKALVDFATVATDSFRRKNEAEHFGFQRKEGCLAAKITNWREKSI